MSEPRIADRLPAVLELEPGTYWWCRCTYWWCRCGLSQSQPFCDGSHSSTDFEPIEFELDEGRKVALCQCKHTGNSPMCDGTHSTLD